MCTVILCQSIKINNDKHVYRQSQVRKPFGSEVKWAECSFITSCCDQVACLILDSPVGMWVGIQSAAIWCPRPPSFESCVHQRKTTCHPSIKKSLACDRASKLTTDMYIYVYINCVTCFISEMEIFMYSNDMVANCFEITFEIARFVQVQVYRIGVSYFENLHNGALECVWIHFR